MDGWIKLHRKTLENPIVCKDGEHIAVWMYLLLNATHKSYPTVFMGNKIILQPGQLITGRKKIAEKFKIAESKVQRILKTFENEQQIEQQNGNKNRLISILSWSDYQGSEQQNEHLVNNNRTTTEQQLNTNKKLKNLENLKNIPTTTDDDEPETLGKAYTKIFNQLHMDGLTSDFFMKIKSKGYTERFCIELLLEAGESCQGSKPSLRYMESIRDRWIKENIYTRAQSKQQKQGAKVQAINKKNEKAASYQDHVMKLQDETRNRNEYTDGDIVNL